MAKECGVSKIQTDMQIFMSLKPADCLPLTCLECSVEDLLEIY